MCPRLPRHNVYLFNDNENPMAHPNRNQCNATLGHVSQTTSYTIHKQCNPDAVAAPGPLLQAFSHRSLSQLAGAMCYWREERVWSVSHPPGRYGCW